MPATLPASENTISGSLTPLSPLPNPAHQRLFNAENSTVSKDGRVFITGSTAVYEVLSAKDAGSARQPYKHCEYSEIGISEDVDVPRDCFRNGITTLGHYLYLACAHVPKWGLLSAFPGWGSPLNEISQTELSNLLYLLVTQNVAHVDSYIVRADLRKSPTQLDKCFKIPEKCFANGLTADKDGALYVANSVPHSSCIYKILWSEDQHAPQCDVLYTASIVHQLNGVKCKFDKVYYSWNQLFPPGLPGLGRIDIQAKTAREQTPENTHASQPPHLPPTIGVFDDFDVLDNGRIVLANNSNVLTMPAIALQIPTGSLIFVSNDDEAPRVFRDEKLFHPSSVKVVDCESKVVEKGDMIVTDKGEHGEYTAFAFRPSDEWQSWFK